MKKQFVFMLLAVCAAPAIAVAASDSFLDTCLRIAAARDKRLTVANEQIALARIRCTRSARAFFPVIAAQRKFSKGKTITDEYESEEFGLRAGQTLFEGGRTRYTYRYDRLTLESAKYNYTKIREELYYKIKLAYYEMLSLKMELANLKKAFVEIEKLHDKVRVEYSARAISELDLLEADNFRYKVENLIKASEINLDLTVKKMTTFVSVNSLDDVPAAVPEGLADDVPEISFTLEDCKGFVPINNLDVKLYQLQTIMADYRRKVNRAKGIPKIYLDGYYGQSGEAYTNQPGIPMTTVWNAAARLQWTLWGNTFEAAHTIDKTIPKSVVDVSNRTEGSSLEMKIGLFDDMAYFVDGKEAKVTLHQSQADFRELLDKTNLEVEKAYNDYANSLRAARQIKREVDLKRRTLDVLRKRNQLYEVPTVQVMEESWRYADLISSYARAVYQNYASVTEIERLTMISLR